MCILVDVGQQLQPGCVCYAEIQESLYHVELADSLAVVDQILADFLKRNPELKVELAGHTDDIGNEKYNLQLSDDRANVVREALIAKGIEASRLTARGYGASKPLKPNDSDEHRALNRRTEMIIIN